MKTVLPEQATECPRLDDQLCFPLYACAKEGVRQYWKPLAGLHLTYTQYLVMTALHNIPIAGRRSNSGCLRHFKNIEMLM